MAKFQRKRFERLAARQSEWLQHQEALKRFSKAVNPACIRKPGSMNKHKG